MTLKELFEQQTDKRAFINKICSRTGKTQAAVYRWINGISKPGLSDIRELAKITGLKINELFGNDELETTN